MVDLRPLINLQMSYMEVKLVTVYVPLYLFKKYAFAVCNQLGLV